MCAVEGAIFFPWWCFSFVQKGCIYIIPTSKQTHAVLTHFQYELGQMLKTLRQSVSNYNLVLKWSNNCFLVVKSQLLLFLFCIKEFPKRISTLSRKRKLCFFFQQFFFAVFKVCLHDCQCKLCLHWQYDRNKHLKPCWALLSKQSPWSSGWHGHSKYSWNTSPAVLKVQLCVICLSLQRISAVSILDSESNEEEVAVNVLNFMFLNFICYFKLYSYGGRLSSVASFCICF